MKRSVLLGLSVFFGAVLAIGWALAPGCQGRFCLGANGEAEVEPMITPQEALTAEQLERIWAESVSERPASVTPSADPAGSVAEVAGNEPEPARAVFLVHAVEPTDAESAERAAAKVAERWTRLAMAALAEPDPELRGEAVHEVGLHRSPEAVTILLEVAADDPDPDNRYQALEQLWYSAADGLDGDRSIQRALEAALRDPDQAIAELAHRALLDLAKLAQDN